MKYLFLDHCAGVPWTWVVAAVDFAKKNWIKFLHTLLSVMPLFQPKTFKIYIALAIITLLFSSWINFNPQFKLPDKSSDRAYQLSIQSHLVRVHGKLLKYQSITGYMPVRNGAGRLIAHLFYTAYTAIGLNRPTTFVFNGGPGSASIWLHMGAFGPVRAIMKDEKNLGSTKSGYIDNPDTWLDFTDLVFIDPVTTGYSRAEAGIDAQQLFNYQADIEEISEFINQYLTQNHREKNPKFLAGESYGSLRAVGLAERLQDQYHVKLNGLTLISPALNYQLINFHHGNETPYSYYLPSYALAAQYHQRLKPVLQNLSIQQLLARATSFAQGLYTEFLNEGDYASRDLTSKVMDSLNFYTGISTENLLKFNGRLTDSQFTKTLLVNDHQVTGTFDSRFTGTDQDTDPSETNMRTAFTVAFNHYVKYALHYQNNLCYQVTTASGTWNYGSRASNCYLDISETLRSVMIKNPALKIQVAAGYYDLATPVGTTEYVIRHLGLTQTLRNNIGLNHYQSGHMIYISKTANAQFKSDTEKFYAQTLSNKI